MGEWLQSGVADDRVGLYVSVPFCRHKCSFCNFASGVWGAGAVEAYVARLCGEIRAAGRIAAELGGVLPGVADSVYLGGGTPSLLPAELMRDLFAAVREMFVVAPDAEITLEAAPGQIADETLEAALGCGVNRVSLGVQSFVDRECAAVGRRHTREECLREFARLGRAGVHSVGADLIAGLPYQTAASWRESLEVACAAEMEHLSVYMLEVDEGSRLGREKLSGGERFHVLGLPEDDRSAEMYELACEWLPGAGFGQYEISNFAREGFRSRHNRKYWERAPYLGFGLDAHSMLLTEGGEAVRFANPDAMDVYAGAESVRDVTRVGLREAFEETVFLGLRLNQGLSRARVCGFPSEWVEAFADAAERMAAEGLMLVEEERWRLTVRGRVISSLVFGELLMEQGTGNRKQGVGNRE